MSNTEKARIQHDAQRTAAARRTPGPSHPEQAILRHLTIELHKSRPRTAPALQEDQLPPTDSSHATDPAPSAATHTQRRGRKAARDRQEA